MAFELTLERTKTTTIADGETLYVYFENSLAPTQVECETTPVVLTKEDAIKIEAATTKTELGTLQVVKAGIVPVEDWISEELKDSTTLVRNTDATVLGRYQNVFVDYTIGGKPFTDIPIKFNDIIPIVLPTGATDIVVKTAPGATDAVVVYDKEVDVVVKVVT